MSANRPPGSREFIDQALAELRAGRWSPRAWMRFLAQSTERSVLQALRRPGARLEITAVHGAAFCVRRGLRPRRPERRGLPPWRWPPTWRTAASPERLSPPPSRSWSQLGLCAEGRPRRRNRRPAFGRLTAASGRATAAGQEQNGRFVRSGPRGRAAAVASACPGRSGRERPDLFLALSPPTGRAVHTGADHGHGQPDSGWSHLQGGGR